MKLTRIYIGALAVAGMALAYAGTVTTPFARVCAPDVRRNGDRRIVLHEPEDPTEVTVDPGPWWHLANPNDATVTHHIGETNEVKLVADVVDRASHRLCLYADPEIGVFLETNAMKKTTVAFSCTPALPPDELVEVSCSGKGELYEKLLDETLSLVTTNLYSACDISNRTFMLHGHNVSGALRDGSIKIKHVKSGAVDIAKYFILHEIGLGKPWLSKQNHMRALSEFGQIREYYGAPSKARYN